MTPAELICLLADGLRAGTLEIEGGGHASVLDLGPAYVEATTLDAPPPRGVPQMFDFRCNCLFVQKKKGN